MFMSFLLNIFLEHGKPFLTMDMCWKWVQQFRYLWLNCLYLAYKAGSSKSTCIHPSICLSMYPSLSIYLSLCCVLAAEQPWHEGGHSEGVCEEEVPCQPTAGLCPGSGEDHHVQGSCPVILSTSCTELAFQVLHQIWNMELASLVFW